MLLGAMGNKSRTSEVEKSNVKHCLLGLARVQGRGSTTGLGNLLKLIPHRTVAPVYPICLHPPGAGGLHAPGKDVLWLWDSETLGRVLPPSAADVHNLLQSRRGG